MKTGYILIVDITSNSTAIGEQQFREMTAESLSHFSTLQGVVGNGMSNSVYYSPDLPESTTKFWSARGVVSLSVGKSRSEHLIHLYQAIVSLISFELPDFEILAEINEFQLP